MRTPFLIGQSVRVHLGCFKGSVGEILDVMEAGTFFATVDAVAVKLPNYEPMCFKGFELEPTYK